MTTRRARLARRLVRRTPALLLEWPFEAFAALSGVLVTILSVGADFHFPPLGVIAHAVGEDWAIAWSAMAALSSLIVLFGLVRDYLRGVIAGLRMFGILYLTYVIVAMGTPAGPPLSVAGAALLLATGVTALFRSMYLDLAIRYAERG